MRTINIFIDLLIMLDLDRFFNEENILTIPLWVQKN